MNATIKCTTCGSPTALGPYCENPCRIRCISCGAQYKISISIEELKPGKIITDPVARAEAIRKRANS